MVTDSSARTLVLGLDSAGTVLHCGQNAFSVLGSEPRDLIGAAVGGLFATEHKETLTGLLDAAAAEHERTAVLGDAVVSVQPMHGGDSGPVVLMTVRVAAPVAARFTDPSMMRRALMEDALTRIGATLDFDQLAGELVNVVVPHFCNVASVLLQESIVVSDESPPHTSEGDAVLRRLALAYDDDDRRWNSTFPTGEVLTYPPGTPYTRCMATGEPVLETRVDAAEIAKLWRRAPVRRLLKGASMVLLPLIARDIQLGFVVCVRAPEYRVFDAYDLEIGMEFAARASLFIDNARQFSRERATALTLQRSMLPTGMTVPSSIEVRHRYLPGNRLVEVGGDWYDSIALPGGRVAMIIGDVAGHGVHAAVTMGRLRTAMRTIVNLELSPVEGLQQLDALMKESDRDPAFATCVYAVYDATNGKIEIASAGHLPPLLLGPTGEARYLDVPPAPPLGVGEGVIESRTFTIADGSLFVLYTDGLVENRGQDIDDGLDRLRRVFEHGALFRPLEDLAKATLDGAYDDHDRDDIAVLITRLRKLPRDHVAWWTMPANPTSVRDARGKVRATLDDWGLGELSFTAELLVSELVTNALRYGTGVVGLRLLRDRSLVIEVYDDSEALPRARRAADDDENGRGLQVVQRLAKRWGARPTKTGKVVWSELQLPGPPPPTESWPGEDLHRG